MPQPDSPSSIRTCAARMIRAVEAFEQDADSGKLRQALLDATLPISQRADLYLASSARPITSKMPNGFTTMIS